VSQEGDFSKSKNWLERIRAQRLYAELDAYAKQGAVALAAATPVRTGETAASWDYEIEITDNQISIYWTNTRKGSDGKTPVAILIQQGHGTRNGGYVQGIDYINPALAPVFESILNAISQKVVSS
jgi:hypothetical protein